MSFIYWGIIGLGVSLADVLPMLDAEEIRLAMQKQKDDVFSETEPEFAEYLQAVNIERFEYLDADLCDITDNICGIIASADERYLITSANNGDGEYYLLYERCYPWNQREGECRTEEEATEAWQSIMPLLTEKEMESLQMKAQGYTYREIAREAGITYSGIKSRFYRMRCKARACVA